MNSAARRWKASCEAVLVSGATLETLRASENAFGFVGGHLSCGSRASFRPLEGTEWSAYSLTLGAGKGRRSEEAL